MWRWVFTWSHSSLFRWSIRPIGEDFKIKWFNQQELSDLILDLSLSKDKAELLASRLKERNLLQSDVRVCHYRIRNNVLKTFFRVDGLLDFCHDISGFCNELKQEYNPSDWRLFIDFSQRSLKAVLLQSGNSKPSIAIAHCVHLKETYDKMKILLEAIQYNVHQWNICGDLKVTGMLMGMQGRFTKFCCCLCIWGGHSTAEHYIKCDWEQGRLVSQEKIVSNTFLSLIPWRYSFLLSTWNLGWLSA